MATGVYTLCAVTSLACAWLLLRAYLRAKQRLLFWSSLCFAGLALNNVILFVDQVVVRTVDLSLPRALSALLALAALVYGLGTEPR